MTATQESLALLPSNDLLDFQHIAKSSESKLLYTLYEIAGFPTPASQSLQGEQVVIPDFEMPLWQQKTGSADFSQHSEGPRSLKELLERLKQFRGSSPDLPSIRMENQELTRPNDTGINPELRTLSDVFDAHAIGPRNHHELKCAKLILLGVPVDLPEDVTLETLGLGY